MKTTLLGAITFCLSLVSFVAIGQPLVGSGTTVEKVFKFEDFNSLKFEDLDGDIRVSFANEYSIKVVIDDNLLNLLQVAKSETTLSMKFLGNDKNKLYIENTNVRIEIKVPSIVAVENAGNSVLSIDKFVGDVLKVKNNGNGDVKITGQVKKLEIRKMGNGSVDAQTLLAENVSVVSRGNGNVLINTSNNFGVSASGNGTVRNVAQKKGAQTTDLVNKTAVPDAGKLPNSQEPGAKPKPTSPRVYSRLQNVTSSVVRFRVMYFPAGTYGFSINPGETHTEYFPVGTKLIQKGRKKTIEITESNKASLIIID